MNLFTAAERVLDAAIITDHDRTKCLCCLAAAPPGAFVTHLDGCAIGVLAQAVQADWQARADASRNPNR